MNDDEAHARSTDPPVAIAGQVTGGRGMPYGAPVLDLASSGYVQEEFFVEGTATSYRTVTPADQDGRWEVAPDGTAPFRTRMLVTRPVDPERFGGTVLAEWNNVSAGFEITLADDDELFDAGFAHVGVSAQYLGVHGYDGDDSGGVVGWDTERYSSLDHPGDRYSHDIYASVGTLLGADRPATGVDPMGGLAVDKVVAVGGSQSAGRLAAQVNAIHLHRPAFDAYVLVTWFGSATDIEDDEVLDLRERALDEFVERPAGTPLRGDLGVPVLVVNSETETMPCVPVRQPDTDSFRYWEVAGTAHATVPDMSVIGAKIIRDGLDLPALPEGGPALPPMCEVGWKPVFAAAVLHLDRWMRGGEPPPEQPRIAVGGEPPAIERDEHGIAVGGIRLPQVDVPLGTHSGENGLPGMAVLYGQSHPFDPATVTSLYPTRDRYLEAFDAATERAEHAGVLTATAAERAREHARTVSWPT